MRQKCEGKKTMLFLSWRDIKAPKKGGAEVFTHEMLSRRNKKRIKVIHFSPMFDGAPKREVIDNVLYIRRGNIYSVIIYALCYYIKHRKKIDYVVDQCNTHRFFTPFWVKKKKRIFFIHQMTREIWLRQMKKPWSIIGMQLESAMTRIYRKTWTLTVSLSTQQDLVDLGFDEDKIIILPEGIDFEPWQTNAWHKGSDYHFTYVGRYASYKGIDATVEAFCRFQKKYPVATLGIIGKKNEEYIQEVLEPIIKKYGVNHEKITYHGFVSEEEKLQLMSQSHCLIFPSEREGWGLTVTEGAAVGTPSIVYNSPGLRDAVQMGQSGFMTSQNTVKNLVELMEKSVIDPSAYKHIQTAAYKFSKELNWDKTAVAFNKAIVKICQEGKNV